MGFLYGSNQAIIENNIGRKTLTTINQRSGLKKWVTKHTQIRYSNRYNLSYSFFVKKKPIVYQ